MESEATTVLCSCRITGRRFAMSEFPRKYGIGPVSRFWKSMIWEGNLSEGCCALSGSLKGGRGTAFCLFVFQLYGPSLVP